MAFSCSVAHTRPWDSRLESSGADPGWNDGQIRFDPVGGGGAFTGLHVDSNKGVQGRCQSTNPHLRFRRVVREGGKTFTYFYWANIFQDDDDPRGPYFKTMNGRYEKFRGDVPLLADAQPEILVADDWIGERPVT